MGRVEAICISARKGEKKSPQLSARLVTNHGIEGDAHAGRWHRQVSLLAAEDIEEMRQRSSPHLKSGDFAENLVISGVDLGRLGLGTRLRIGSEVILTLTQLGKACHQRCAIYYQAGDCIMPRLGVFARVLRGRIVVPGDAVEAVEAVPRSKPQAVLLTIGSRSEITGTSESAVKCFLQDVLQAHIYAAEVLPDDRNQLAARLRHYSNGHSIDLVLVLGGTGPLPDDVLRSGPAAMHLSAPSLVEPLLPVAMERTPTGTLRRDMPVIRDATLILALPGTDIDAVDCLISHLPALRHHQQRKTAAA
jgi:molybdopterin adenylyltransferase